MRFKEYHLIKQGLHKFKTKEKKKSKIKIIYIAEMGSINTPNPYLSLLFSSFNFNFSFLILPDIISNNTPIPFL